MALACLMGLLILIAVVAQPNGAAGACAAFLVLGVWWHRTGLDLLRLRPEARPRALVVAVVLMIGTNGLFLFAGGEPFSTSVGWIAFHVWGMAVGVYTLVVMLRPGVSELLRGGR